MLYMTSRSRHPSKNAAAASAGFPARTARRIDKDRVCYLKRSSREPGELAPIHRAGGIEALYRRPNTSKPVPGHKVYPFLLRNLPVTRPNQAWAMDITYIPMARGFVYLAAVVDWFSRRVLAWRRLSITLETGRPRITGEAPTAAPACARTTRIDLPGPHPSPTASRSAPRASGSSSRRMSRRPPQPRQPCEPSI